MGKFAPEFSQYWKSARAAPTEVAAAEKRDDEGRDQQAALEELADRVTAARSVV